MEKKREIKTKTEWLKLLKNGEASCYIKPNRYVHDSGFRCFEVGYLTIGAGNRMEDKLVLNATSDHIQLYNDYINNGLKPNLDLLLDGYIRIYSLGAKREELYWWGNMDFVCSSAQLELLSKV